VFAKFGGALVKAMNKDKAKTASQLGKKGFYYAVIDINFSLPSTVTALSLRLLNFIYGKYSRHQSWYDPQP